MGLIKNLGLAALISIPLIGNPVNADYSNRNSYLENRSYNYQSNNYQNFRTDYDPNLSKPKVTDSLDLSGAIPLGVLTAGFLALLFTGSTSKHSIYRKK